MKNEPVFLTDKNHNIVLEALSPAPNAALPDSCKPFEILDPAATEGAAEKHLPVVEQDGLHVDRKSTRLNSSHSDSSRMPSSA